MLELGAPTDGFDISVIKIKCQMSKDWLHVCVRTREISSDLFHLFKLEIEFESPFEND